MTGGSRKMYPFKNLPATDRLAQILSSGRWKIKLTVIKQRHNS